MEIINYVNLTVIRVQIDNVLSDFANIICGVPQGSVLGRLKFCLYLLPLSAILRYHNIGYHVYADDTHIRVIFDQFFNFDDHIIAICRSTHFHIRNMIVQIVQSSDNILVIVFLK